MVIVVDVGRDGGGVVIPFLAGEDAISVTVAERGEELHEDLFGGHLARDHLGVMAAVVDDAEVGRGDGAVSVTVELSEASSNDVLAGLVGLAAEADKELVVGDDSVFVGVEVLEEDLGLTHGDGGTEVLNSPVELLLVDFAVAVVIEDAEGTAHATDGADATGVEAVSYLVEDCERKEVRFEFNSVTYFLRDLLIRPLC